MDDMICSNKIGDLIWKSDLDDDQKNELMNYKKELFSPYYEVTVVKKFDHGKPTVVETKEHISNRPKNEELSDFEKYNKIVDVIWESRLGEKEKVECLEFWRRLFTPFIQVVDAYSLDTDQKKKLIQEKINVKIVDGIED